MVKIMSFRFSRVAIGLLVLVNIMVALNLSITNGISDITVETEQPAEGQGQQSMAPASPSEATVNAPTETPLDLLGLYVLEAALGNWSACENHASCADDADRILAWLCAASVCEGTDINKTVFDCIKLGQYSQGVQDQISSSLCSVIKSPSPETRQALLSLLSIPTATEEEIVEKGAYLMALKGSAKSCENYIKNYVGEYGPRWSYKWYRRLAGCRILARERTLGEEEKDFNTWFGVVKGSGNCSDIINSEMRMACNAPGAASPITLVDDYIEE